MGAAPRVNDVGTDLSDRDRRILDFEHQWWKYAGSKEEAVKELFDLSPTRYYQLLTALLDDPDAWAYAPITVKRLRDARKGPRLS